MQAAYAVEDEVLCGDKGQVPKKTRQTSRKVEPKAGQVVVQRRTEANRGEQRHLFVQICLLFG
jgi:hypothetical protein